MSIPGTTLTKTMAKQFISAVDTGNAERVHAFLQNAAVKEAMPGELGKHAVKNLDSWVPRLQAQYLDELKYPVAAMDAANDKALLGRFKTIVAELRDSGAGITEKLASWLKAAL